MKRACLALALTWPLTACVSLPHFGKPTVAATTSAPPVCPGGLRADLLPQPPLPANATFPAPQDDAAVAAVAAYTTWLHDLALWGRQGWARAANAKAFCETAR